MTLGRWTLEPTQLAPCLLFGAAYAIRARELATRGRPVSRRRQLSFYSGVAAIVAALVSPLDYVGEHHLFYAHMVQHLLLGDIGPLLVVLGLTGPLLRPLLAVRWLRLGRGLAHPLVALPLWVVNLYAWHLPVLYQVALRHNAVHALEHAMFFIAGALMWAAVIEPLPGPVWFSNGWKAVYTLAVRAAGTVLGNIFLWAAHPFYPYYVALDRGTGVSPLTDQRIAGAIMFIEGGVVTLLAFAWLFFRFTREAEIRQRLLERNVDEALATRAARYGRSSRVHDVS